MAVFVLLATGEGVYRLLGYWKNGTSQAQYECDAELGWQTARGYRGREAPMRDRLGRQYTRSLRTDAHGSRLWGTHPGAPRLLFLGDSFTLASEVSDDKTYSAVFSQLSAAFDVYAYGGGGYGTLQEAMMLKRLLGELRPDVLVLQFSENDFTNNSLELERQTTLFQQMIRPYLVQGAVVYRFPETHPYRIGLCYSRLFARIVDTVSVALYRVYGDMNRLPRGPERDALERRAVEVSEQLLLRVASTVPRGTRLYAFNRDESREETDRWFEEISAKAGFRVIRNIASYVDAQESHAETTLSQDGTHWNEFGNLLVGERLARYFRDQGDTPVGPTH
jgi:hypothetical protein